MPTVPFALTLHHQQQQNQTVLQLTTKMTTSSTKPKSYNDQSSADFHQFSPQPSNSLTNNSSVFYASIFNPSWSYVISKTKKITICDQINVTHTGDEDTETALLHSATDDAETTINNVTVLTTQSTSSFHYSLPDLSITT